MATAPALCAKRCASRFNRALTFSVLGQAIRVKAETVSPSSGFVEHRANTRSNKTWLNPDIDVAVAAPLRDRQSGLTIDSAGCRHLAGPQALALARARHLEYFVDGTWMADGTGDLGRMQRQRAFLTAAFTGLADQTPTPFTADGKRFVAGSSRPNSSVTSVALLR